MRSKKLTYADLNVLLTHIVDRYVDFHIILNHAKLNKKDTLDKASKTNECFYDIWHEHGYNDKEIQDFNLINDTWDCLQSSFSYDRILDPDAFPEDKKSRYKESWYSLYEITENEHVNGCFSVLTNDFDHLNWIRMADIVSVPSVFEYLMSYKNYQKELTKLRSKFSRLGLSLENELDNEFIEAINSPDIKPVFYYPEKLHPWIRFMIPEVPGAQPNSFFAIGCHYNASPKDIQEAFADYPYQFEKYKNYHFLNENNFSDIPELEKVKHLMTKNTTENKCISKSTSIEITLISLLVWEQVNIDGIEINEAINSINKHELLASNLDGNKKTQIKNKVKWIEEQIGLWGNNLTM